ncbi:MAG: glycosyltransferase family 2 protein [Clostridia bacterium]|nr:glycosyltransferase family 2 protein [Clostridia bacterium]
MKYTVSVIIPVYNMEAYLDQCLETVFEQTLEGIEVLCVDDGSMDGSAQILKSWRQKYPDRMQVIRQENSGAAAARNRGIDAAQGEYVIFMDPDDYYPDAQVLSDLYTAAKKNGALIAGGSFAEIRGEEIVTEFEESIGGYTFDRDGMMTYREYQFDFGYHRFIYHTQLLREKGIRFPLYTYYEDPPFFAAAMIAAGEFYALKRLTYCYRYGYKAYDWTPRRAMDMLRGMRDLLETSKAHGLDRLHRTTVARLEANGYAPFMQNIMQGDMALLAALVDASKTVVGEWMGLEEGESYWFWQLRLLAERALQTTEAQREARQAKREVKAVYDSRTYRFGNAVLALPKRVYALVKRFIKK